MNDYSVPVVVAVAAFVGQLALVATWAFRAIVGTAR